MSSSLPLSDALTSENEHRGIRRLSSGSRPGPVEELAHPGFSDEEPVGCEQQDEVKQRNKSQFYWAGQCQAADPELGPEHEGEVGYVYPIGGFSQVAAP